MSPIDREKAIVFDIQRFSIHDGPGIRTSVFLKGCPLSCEWCHNPEAQNKNPRLMYKNSLCRKCGLCISACEQGVHTFDASGNHIVNFDFCKISGQCIKTCCYEALSISGTWYSVDELLEEIKSDFPYFKIGNEGGVTFTGGEPMLWSEFIAAFAEIAKDISICIETSGYAPTKAFKDVLPKIDMFLFDWKITNKEKHVKYCGASNELILENLKFLHEQGANIILRLPIIPGVNDDDEHFLGIAKIMHDFNSIIAAEILPYHSIGKSKVEWFGLKNQKMFSVPTQDQKLFWLKRLKELGVKNILLT
ncbi:MAG: glycyl-radical enzyme activating protein [Spirochaetales bacterium]|nr:glycyl-radical enzyme activating protein [Spirochaetales bacterium]